MGSTDRLIRKIQRCLSPDLLKPEWRGDPNPVAGHCYVASEVAFHLLGGKRAGYTPMFIRHEGGPHWWVRGPRGEVIDPTASQCDTPVPYDLGTPKGFLTRQPSRRARILIQRVASRVEG